MPSPTLIPVLVPSPLFHKSVHDLFNNDKRWKRIRDATRAKVDNRCSACATQDNPHCNEVWNYRDSEAIGAAELIAFEILCRDCHNAHHIGRIIALRDRAILDAVLAHLAKVNGISPKEAVALVDTALKTHAKRSKQEIVDDDSGS
jgi:predicted nucleic acid-binding protein